MCRDERGFTTTNKKMNFQNVNNIFGWAVFAVALLTYFLTMEEPASYWDCGEFIAVSYKLQVPHPPGAPLFLLLGRAFSFLALGDVTKVAYWINFLSVLASAFTILFLFWSITLFGRKMMGIKKDSEITENQLWLLMGAGLVGSLAYTFSDSAWFSAVEAEVYGMSSFFTAFVVWGVLKWDVIEDESKANRWLLLVAYMIGLSIGVHMLNLVTMPALGLIYYFKKYKITTWGVIATLAFSGGLVLFINDLIVPGLPSLAGDFEVFFVNTLGLPFGSGATVFGLLCIAALIFGIRYSQLKNKPVLNTFLLATTFILIGYCSYATVVIRSNFNTPINEDAPKDIMSVVRYLKREQYGSRPLLTGPYFTAKPIGVKYGAPVYTKGKDKYEITERMFTYEYEPGEETLLPRAWNSEHAETYRSILGLAEGQKPTFFQDKFVYMLNQQIGAMYMRYFMWNFAGRESDDQGADWLGPRQWFEKVPAVIAQNKARNNYFMIPFLLGLIGMFCQFLKDTKNFAVVALLFIMLGLAIVVYLNSPPVEPRARDYIYAGSTYAFALLIGLAVIALHDYFHFTDLKIKMIHPKAYLDLLWKNYSQLRFEDVNIVASRILVLDINKQDVIGKGIIPRGMDSLVVDRIQFKLAKSALEKKDLAFLDLLATNNWERPLYLNHTSLAQLNINVEDYAILEGNAYRILPIKKPNPDKDFVNTEVAYENMIHKFHYRGLDNDKLYYTEDYNGFVLNHRSSLNSLAESLIDQGDLKKAREVLLFSLEKMPDKGVRYDHTAVTMVDLLFKVGEKEKAVEISGVVGNRSDEMATYLIGKGDSGMELRRNIYILGNLYQILYKNGENDLGKKLEDAYNKHIEAMQIKRGAKRGDF